MKRLNDLPYCCLVLLLGMLTGCSPSGCSREDEPKVPERLHLFPTEPVLAARFVANDSGYTLEPFLGRAAPTRSVIQDFPVRIMARDAQGETVAWLSVPNPRQIRSAGDSEHDFDTNRQGSFVIFLPKPELIRTVDVHVVSGPNAGLQKTFSIQTNLPLFSLASSSNKVPTLIRRHPSPHSTN